MRFHAEEISPSGKKRYMFAVGMEEIEVLSSMLTETMKNYPVHYSKATDSLYERMKNMRKAFYIFLGIKKDTVKRPKDTPCTICKRKLKGELGLEKHMLANHSKG